MIVIALLALALITHPIEKVSDNKSKQDLDSNLKEAKEVNISQITIIGQCVGQNLSENTECRDKDLNKDEKIDVADLNFYVQSVRD